MSIRQRGLPPRHANPHLPSSDARFGADPRGAEVQTVQFAKLSVIQLALIANVPQLILSLCYMAYNGLYTRMLAEFEWASFSTQYKPLRVSSQRGLQRSTYRLQLPYRYSIPLIIVSVLLHWLYSNCIYLGIYDCTYSPPPFPLYSFTDILPPDYDWSWLPSRPDEGRHVRETLQYSVLTILISLVISIIFAAVPIVLAWVKLPGNMVLAGGNSVVISAACHVVIPGASSSAAEEDGGSNGYKGWEASQREFLETAATGFLKWGEVPGIGGMDEVTGRKMGHLTFGTPEQGLEGPREGRWYAGTW